MQVDAARVPKSCDCGDKLVCSKEWGPRQADKRRVTRLISDNAGLTWWKKQEKAALQAHCLRSCTAFSSGIHSPTSILNCQAPYDTGAKQELLVSVHIRGLVILTGKALEAVTVWSSSAAWTLPVKDTKWLHSFFLSLSFIMSFPLTAIYQLDLFCSAHQHIR